MTVRVRGILPCLREPRAIDTAGMEPSGAWPSTMSRPRVLAIGSMRQPLHNHDRSLADALERHVELMRVDARAPVRESLAAFRAASRAVRRGDAELVHLLDARFAVAGMMIQRHLRVPVSVTVSSLDTQPKRPWSKLALRAVAYLDHAFASDDVAAREVRLRAPHVPLSVVLPAATVLPWPSKRRLAAVTRALRGVQPGRLVLAMPWPDNRNDLRWFRDFVQPQLDGAPLCLLMGVPSRREARLLLGATGALPDFRILTGRIVADSISAVSRYVDAFVAPSRVGAAAASATSELAIALSCAGVPVVTNIVEDAFALAHERSAFLVDPGDERGFVETLNDVLALPAIQRQALGAEFARFTLARWSWEAPAAVYADRFAALVGRPQIPAQLRAA